MEAEPPRKKTRTEKSQPSSLDGMSNEKQFWLMKAEPESRLVNGQDGLLRYKKSVKTNDQTVKFSIDDLKKMEISPWDGVRNAEASKLMKERMKVGDLAFFYHSNCKNPGIAGSYYGEAYPDYTAWDKNHPYYDIKSTKEKPKWYMVDVKYLRHLSRFISLYELKKYKEGALKNMMLLRRPRLSVQNVTSYQWDFILGLEKEEVT